MVSSVTEQQGNDLAERAGDHWRLWQAFLRLCFVSAIAIMIVLALMWIFLV